MKTSICTDAGKYEFYILFDHIRWAYCFSFKVFSFFFQGLVFKDILMHDLFAHYIVGQLYYIRA